MENKKLYIGLGVLALAGIGYYIWKKNEEKEKSKLSSDDMKSNVTAIGGQKKCKCEGVKSNDGFGNPRDLYSFACCQKTKK
jgi:hypothetical protein